MSQTLTDARPDQKVTPAKISYEEFLERYDGIRAEWIDGEVELMSAVSSSHQRIGNFLFRILTEFVEVHDLGEVFQLEFQMKLARERRGREPDLFFVAKSRLDRLEGSFFDGAGDLVIEIISPESIERDTVDKFGEYQSGGVPEFWLIDPPSQQIRFFRRDANGLFQPAFSNADGIYHSVGLPGFWLREGWLWQSPMPLMSTVRRELGLP